jgi:ribonuclease HIII
VRATPEEARELARSGAIDSKKIADSRARVLGAALRSRYAHHVVSLSPESYNAEYALAGAGRLNEVLADLHARAIRALAQPGDHVLVDQFARKTLVEKKLAGLDVELEQRPRAEEDPVVAAASVIAREAFLVALDELSERFAVDLHKGAGAPVDTAGVHFCELHGLAALDAVAKLHFKNTRRIEERLR